MTKLKSLRKPKLNSSNRRRPKSTSGNPFAPPKGSRNRAKFSPEERAAEEIFRVCLQIAKITNNRALLRRMDRIREKGPSISLRRIAAMGEKPVGVVGARESNLGGKAPRTISFKEIQR